MTRLFLRLYAVIAGSILLTIVATVLVVRVLLTPSPADAREHATRVVVQAFGELPEGDALAAVSRQLHTRVEVAIPGSQPPPQPDATPLRVALGDGRSVWVWVPNMGGPRPVVPVAAGGLLLVMLGAALVWWLRPLHRGLEELTEGARRLGREDLDARVPLRPGAPTAELALGFNDMAARLSELVRGQEELLVGVSHELRTPLMRLRFGLELLADAPPDQAERLEALLGDVDQLDALVGEVLSWGRSQHVTKARFDLCDLLGVVAEEIGRTAPGLRVEVALPTSLEVVADEGLVGRAARNLTSNALRYGRGRVRVWARAEDDGVVFGVDDDGPGIPAAERARVLQPFVCLDPARAAGGTGLGLALVDRVARAHGGRVVIEDAPEGGASVRVWIPRR